MKNFYKKVIDESGSVFYYNEKGQPHRIDGPAVEYSHGTKHWYINNKKHREDGPAIIYVNGFKEEWYLDNKEYTEEDFLYLLKYKEIYNYHL